MTFWAPEIVMTIFLAFFSTPEEEDILSPIEVTAERRACLPQFEVHCTMRNTARLADESN